MKLTADYFKEHIRLDGYEGDDAYIGTLLEVARAQVLSDLDAAAADWAETDEWPAALVHAACMFAAHLYNTREAVAVQQPHAVPYGYEALVKPYVRFSR